MWRWADSNRRPNMAPGSFLHAYPLFGCRRRTAGRQAIMRLSFESWQDLKESSCASGLDDTPYSGHDRPEARRDTRRDRSLGGRRLSETALQTTQRVHNCCCQLIVRELRLTGKSPTPGVLTVQCLMLSKPKHPHRRFLLYFNYTIFHGKCFTPKEKIPVHAIRPVSGSGRVNIRPGAVMRSKTFTGCFL